MEEAAQLTAQKVLHALVEEVLQIQGSLPTGRSIPVQPGRFWSLRVSDSAQ